MNMPREIPIPYSPEMVRARRAGIKTNTRRVIVQKHGGKIIAPGGPSIALEQLSESEIRTVLCPYGQPGDLLWVREAWRTLAIYNDLPPRDLPRDAQIWYEADGPAPVQFSGGRYRHARFMMRWMSRGLDEVVEIRVEKLQDISEADAKAEGCQVPFTIHPDEPRRSYIYAEQYRLLWESINGPDSWLENPWVWVVHFKVLKP
jgi:hypothetical protein